MTAEQENFAITLTDQCVSHESWLSVVRFGLKTLLEDQALLVEIIFREATREVERSGVKSRVPADEARKIIDELGLKFVLN